MSYDLGRQLLEVASLGDTLLIKSLIANGAPFTTNWFGNSPLHMTAQAGHVDAAELLIQAGIAIDLKTKLDRTALHLAAQEGHHDVVELLIKYGADVKARDALHMTALHWAAQNGNQHIVESLLRAGAERSDPNKFGKTPAHIADQEQYPNIRYMIENVTYDVEDELAARSIEEDEGDEGEGEDMGGGVDNLLQYEKEEVVGIESGGDDVAPAEVEAAGDAKRFVVDASPVKPPQQQQQGSTIVVKSAGIKGQPITIVFMPSARGDKTAGQTIKVATARPGENTNTAGQTAKQTTSPPVAQVDARSQDAGTTREEVTVTAAPEDVTPMTATPKPLPAPPSTSASPPSSSIPSPRRASPRLRTSPIKSWQGAKDALDWLHSESQAIMSETDAKASSQPQSLKLTKGGQMVFEMTKPSDPLPKLDKAKEDDDGEEHENVEPSRKRLRSDKTKN